MRQAVKTLHPVPPGSMEDGQRFDSQLGMMRGHAKRPIDRHKAADLFQKAFHQKVYDRLNDNGIMVAQSESPFYNQETVRSMYGNLREIFSVVKMYTCFMPIYPSGYWSFAFCSKGLDPIGDFDEARWGRLALETEYYNAETHRAAFALPQFVKSLLA